MRNARPGLGFLLVSLVFAGLAAGCAIRPNGFGPVLEEGPRPVYRNLADLPEKPPVLMGEAAERAKETLTEDRAMAAAAADKLRREPFTTPDPAPPKSEF
jgi:hypothetical protein